MMDDTHKIDSKKIAEYSTNGVIKIKGVFALELMKKLAQEIDREVDEGVEKAFSYKRAEEENGFFGTQDIWRTNPTCRAICTESILPRIVGELMQSSSINLFYDHVFVKNPKTSVATNLHNDGAYWPINGNDIASAWVSVDTARSGAGAMMFVLESHRWGTAYQPVSFALRADKPIEDTLTVFARKTGIDPSKLSFQIIETQPGDVLIFNSRTLHAAFGNNKGSKRRRGYVIRYTGSDVTYDSRRAGVHKMMLEPKLDDGKALTCERFPQVWKISNAPS